MHVYQLSGAGNDFLALAEPERTPSPLEIRAWCRRGVSLGADGLFVLSRVGPGRVRMDYWNADGGGADLCLNGTRCAARLAFVLGWDDGPESPDAERRIVVETGAGPFPARALPGGAISVDLPAPDPDPASLVRPRTLRLDGVDHAGFLVDPGVPHLVLAWDDLAEAPVDGLGRRLRHHPDLGPAGANVDFVRFVDRHRLALRSYERGVEAETLACGTGVVAAVAAGLVDGRLALPVEVTTRGGFVLTVEGEIPDPEGTAGPVLPERWALAGDARLLAHGELLPDASVAPEPPRWAPGPAPDRAPDRT